MLFKVQSVQIPDRLKVYEVIRLDANPVERAQQRDRETEATVAAADLHDLHVRHTKPIHVLERKVSVQDEAEVVRIGKHAVVHVSLAATDPIVRVEVLSEVLRLQRGSLEDDVAILTPLLVGHVLDHLHHWGVSLEEAQVFRGRHLARVVAKRPVSRLNLQHGNVFVC